MKKILQGGALLISGVLLAGCGSSGYQNASVGTTSDAAPDLSYELPESRDTAATSFEELEPNVVERQIITTGEIYATAADPFKAADAVLNLVTEADGFIEDRNQYGTVADGNASVSFTARIPADKATATISAVEDAVKVYEISTNKQDVTDQVTDVEARIKALQTSVDRLTTLLEEAKTSEALFEAEDALTRRQAELDSLRAVQRNLRDQVALATLTIHIGTDELATPPADGFLGGLKSGWNALVSSFLAAVTAIGAIVPWLLVLVPVGLVIFWLIRRFQRRRAGRHEVASTTDAAATTKVEPDPQE